MAEARRILLIEDNEEDASFAAKVLRDKGYSVEVASNGRDGLKKAKGERFDLIILELLLPDMKGEQICSQLKVSIRCRRIPVVVFSIKDSIDDIEELFAKGADDYIIKPTSAEHLLSKVEKYIR